MLMRILGVDPGSIITGYGVVDDDNGSLSLVGYGVIKSGRKKPFPERLRKIYDGLNSAIEKYRPAHIVVEKVFYGKSVKTAIKIGESRGIAILCAAIAKTPVYEYAPTVIKKSVVGLGGAQKTQVREMVRVILNAPNALEFLDASDALAIAICHCHRRKLMI